MVVSHGLGATKLLTGTLANVWTQCMAGKGVSEDDPSQSDGEGPLIHRNLPRYMSSLVLEERKENDNFSGRTIYIFLRYSRF